MPEKRPSKHRPYGRLERRLRCHQALHDPRQEARNLLPWLPRLRRWQAQRLERSFQRYLEDPLLRPAARFFLTDVYGDHDFSRRNADIVRVVPTMQGLLPPMLLDSIADAIELGVLTQALDLRMAAALTQMAPRRRRLDDTLYADAYRKVGLPRLRMHQIDLIGRVGAGLADAVRRPGISIMLKISRVPARATGLVQLQVFLEHGFDAFGQLGDVGGFLAEIAQAESAISRRLFAAEPDPFVPR